MNKKEQISRDLLISCTKYIDLNAILYTSLYTHTERKEDIEKERDREKDSKRDNNFSRFIFYF